MKSIVVSTLFGFGLLSCQPDTTVTSVPQAEASRTPTPSKFRQGKLHPLPTGLITAGKSVGPLSLGASYEEALSALGETLDEFDIDATEMHWMELESHDNGIFAYVRDDKVFEIDCHSLKFTLENGIKNEVAPQKLKPFYPNLKAYRLLHSGGKEVGGEDLVYWIDESQGIAFTIYYYPSHRRKLVGTITVFEPSPDFRPREFSPPREWVKIPDWTY